MRSLLRDWRCWSRAERVFAVAIVASNVIGMPLAIAMNIQ
jgi:hypothetical protein